MAGCRNLSDLMQAQHSGLRLNRESPMTHGLLALWPFMDGDGYPRDIVGTQPVGSYTATVPTWVVRERGRTLDFSASTTSQYVVADNAALDSLTTAITLSGWYRPTNLTSAFQSPIDKARTEAFCLFIAYADPGAHRYILHIGGSRTDHFWFSTLALDTWHHLACTFDGATVKIYENAVEVYSSATAGALGTGSQDLYFGRTGDGQDGGWGQMGPQGIWNRALTPLEIRHLYMPQTRYDLFARARRPAFKAPAAAASTIALHRANAGLRWGPFAHANAGVGAI